MHDFPNAITAMVLSIEKGVKRLSQVNIVAAALLLAGPTSYLIESLLQNIGIYIQYLLRFAT